MGSNDEKPVRTAWALTAGAAGMRAQARGLAEAVAHEVVEKTIGLRQPWKRLPTWAPFVLHGLDAGSDPVGPPWPELIVTSGRKAAAIGLALKKKSGGKIALAHVQDPLTGPGGFDLVVAMHHDRISGPNVVKLSTALHHVTQARLAAAAEAWRGRLARFPRPLIGVSLGGPTQRAPFGEAQARRLVEAIDRVRAATGAGVVVAPSRRTPAEITAVLEQAWKDDPGAWVWDGAGDNPYLGMLALADRLVVTADSVSMVSEALATGHPVEVFRLDLGRRHMSFIDGLVAEGLVRPFEGDPEPPTAHAPLDATLEAARVLRQVLKARSA
jgi:mitochondrial fission protein ELM1